MKGAYIMAMRHAAFAAIFAIFSLPVAAQDAGDEAPSLMERGAQLFIEGLLKEMEPAIDDLGNLAEEFGPAIRQFANEMGPKLRELMDEVEDWSAYEAPEILPNGDIIIRRKADRPYVTPKEPPSVEL